MALKLKDDKFRLDIRKKFFIVRVMEHCNILPRVLGDSPSLQIFSVSVDEALCNLFYLKMSLVIAMGVGLDGL